jgi:hypothetical protein
MTGERNELLGAGVDSLETELFLACRKSTISSSELFLFLFMVIRKGVNSWTTTTDEERKKSSAFCVVQFHYY